MDNSIAKLIELVQKLPESCVADAIDFVNKKLEETAEEKATPACPNCKCNASKKNGRTEGRRRYLCRDCNKTYGDTTNTYLAHTHFGEAVWK
jgi:transposase-like protein